MRTTHFFLLLVSLFLIPVLASYICPNPESYADGKYHGESHECVALVKEACKAPQTTLWKKGTHVKGNQVPKGAAIATFNDQGKYEGHAAIYLSQDNFGIKVVDQWQGQPGHTRVIKFDDSRTPSNNGNKFYVVE